MRSILSKKLIIGILLLAVIIAGCVVLYHIQSGTTTDDRNNTAVQTTAAPTAKPGNVAGWISHNLVLNAPAKESADTVMVYRTLPQHYTREDSFAMAKKFNISNIGITKEVEEGSSIASEDGTMYAILHNSGFIEYTNSNRAHTINPIDIPENLPTDEEAIKIATEFLKERDLLPDGAVFGGVTHGKIYKLVRDGDDIVAWEDIQVWFKRELDGYPVKGTQLMLSIGGGGDAIEFFTNWRNYEPYKELPVKSLEQAFEELKEKGVNAGRSKEDALVSFDEAYLAYHTKAGAETEEYLEPVWVFEGNVMVDDKAVKEVQEFIPALKEEPAELISK